MIAWGKAPTDGKNRIKNVELLSKCLLLRMRVKLNVNEHLKSAKYDDG